jgi:hypothetical protein
MVAYTMFNVYLPKLLENRTGKGSEPGGNREEVMWDVVIYTVAGCPGALVRTLLHPLWFTSHIQH